MVHVKFVIITHSHIPMSEYIIATSLKPRLQTIRDQIEDLVQKHSRIESYGNATFSLMLLTRFERQLPITAPFVSQSAISACMRSVCVRKQHTRPSEVCYKYSDVQACMRTSQQIVTQRMRGFDSDEGIPQILNDAARRYLNVFKNNFSEHMATW
jgi:hypothetical protein